MGINVGRVYFVTFTLGTMLAALGGALIAPKVSVVPAMGVEVIVLAFAVVVIGGLGAEAIYSAARHRRSLISRIGPLP